MSRYMTANEAADALGVAVQTIYAYVSRGMIRSEETNASKRTRRYYAEDIERLIQQKETARHPEKVTEEALHWGMPLLESALTLITDTAPYYRGYNALQLAEDCSIEQIAALLWVGDLDADMPFSSDHPAVDACLKLLNTLDYAYLTGLQRMQTILPIAAAEDVTAYDLSPQAIVRTGARILRLLGAVTIRDYLGDRDLATALSETWSPEQPEACKVINAAFILCADHELNASSFTARVIAGAGANPYAVVIGGLSAFQGINHGGATERAGAFLREAEQSNHIRTFMTEKLRRGEPVPGFGHPLYAGGVDPRAGKLLTLIETLYPDAPALDLVRTVAHLIDRPPNIDVALAAMALTLGYDVEQSTLIFALGRVTGWIAHAIEQYDGRMIRPRARYTGIQPRSSD